MICDVRSNNGFAQVAGSFIIKVLCLDQHRDGTVIVYESAVFYDDFFQVQGSSGESGLSGLAVESETINIIIRLPFFIHQYMNICAESEIFC